MNWRHVFLMATFLGTSTLQGAEGVSMGFVNFKRCVEESAVGKKEENAFTEMKEEMQKQLETKEKELSEMQMKFNDPDFLDSLSPEAEAQMKQRYTTSAQELSQLQNRYYQMLNQANFKIIQGLTDSVSEAAAVVAKEKKIQVMLNVDSAFYVDDSLDTTEAVIEQMNRTFSALVGE